MARRLKARPGSLWSRSKGQGYGGEAADSDRGWRWHLPPPRRWRPACCPRHRARRGRRDGPYPLLVIRGATIITGNGGPPYGPADIIIKGNRIAEIRPAGTPGLPMAKDREPRGAAREIDATGMFVMPGFVDMHGHNGDPDKANDPSYAYRLWLAHGVTTVRGVSFFGGDAAHALDDKRRSAAGEITAPRLYVYQTLGSGWDRRPGADAGKGARMGALGRQGRHRRHQVLQPRRRNPRNRPRRHRRGEEARASAPSRTCRSPISPNSTPAMPPPPGLAPSRISMVISKRC